MPEHMKNLSPKPGKNSRRSVIAATLGNVLEIYDFIAFGLFSITISKVFFPNASELNALLFTWGVFALGFVARPAGALVLGRYADRHGRKKSLTLTLLLMATGTLILTVCPGYNTIGIAAPVIVILGRMIQGFSAGGEIGCAVATLVENAPHNRRYFYASFQQATQGAGVLLAGCTGLLLNALFTEQQLLDGYWRLAFAVGLLIVPVGWYIRRSTQETLLFEQQQISTRPVPSLWAQLVKHRHSLSFGLALMVFWTIATYLSNYFTAYSVKELHLSATQAFLGQVVYSVTLLLVCPLAGLLADRTGPAFPMFGGTVAAMLLTWPLFDLLTRYPSLPTLLAAQALIALMLGAYAACASTVLSNLFPIDFGVSGVGFSYALGVTVFGGATPLLVTWLISLFGKMTIAYYLMAAAAVSMVALWRLRHRLTTGLPANQAQQR